MKLRPPPSLDPRVIDHRLPVDPATGNKIQDGTLTGVRAAFASAFSAMESLANLRDATTADETMTAAARELKIRNAAISAGERAAKTLDAARVKTEAELNRVRAESLPRPPLDPAIAGEIRAALRGMDAKTRGQTIDAAVTNGDGATVGAVLAGADFLSGLATGQRSMAEFGWRGRHHPDQLDRIERLDSTLQAIEIGAGALLGFVKSTASHPLAAAAEAAQQRTAAAEAALKDNAAAQPAPQD